MPAKKPERMTVAQAAATDDRMATLKAMRDQLAAQMTEADTNVVAQIAARLQSVLDAIDAVPTTDEVSTADDLARKRANRIAAAAGGAPAAQPAQ
jgi:hypothetical protein